MKDIIISDNPNEMSEIGRNLFKKYRLFTKQQIGAAYETINRFMPNASEDEKNHFFYRFYYDYMMYGFNVEQEFYLHLLNKTHGEKQKYLTHASKFLYYSRLNKRSSMHILEDKYEAYQFLKGYYRREIIKISNEKDFDLFSDFITRHPEFVVKPIDLSNGLGIRKVDSRVYNDKKKLYLELLNAGKEYDNSQEFKWSTDLSGSVLEEIIIQDDAINKMNPNSVNSVRVTTIRVNNEIHIYYPWIKVGSGDAFVVSAILGGFDACINAESGIVETDGVLESGMKIQYHPDTNCKIKGFQIPKWDELIKLAKEVASKMDSTINYVGWDFVLTPNGWVIMEGNFYGDVMWQMCYDKGMKEDFENLIGWKPEKKYWWQYTLAELEQ